jgi:hypothetical protein
MKSGFRLIPKGVRILAALVFAAAVCLCCWFFSTQSNIVWGAAIGVGSGAILAGLILLCGYVYADAARRGMPAIPWTALALLVPNCLGFVLYFLLRKPIVHPCPRCAYGVAADAAFCPRCGQPQTDAQVQESLKLS